jgi:hypothetical protein
MLTFMLQSDSIIRNYQTGEPMPNQADYKGLCFLFGKHGRALMYFHPEGENKERACICLSTGHKWGCNMYPVCKVI